jgi:prepilin-type N-terminal cleavage/methylation domain-containing protein
MKKNQTKSQGFTIIELLIATLVFSIVLVVILAAFVQISRLFYKGVNMSRTQEDTRAILQSIAGDIQFSQNPPTTLTYITNNNRPATGVFCIGLHRYTYQLGYQLGSSSINNFGVMRDDVSFASGCNTSAPGTNPVEMLENGMQLNNLTVDCSSGRCVVSIHVIFYGGPPNGIFSSASNPGSSTPWTEPDAECTGSLTDTQYCATADFSSTILQRS